MIIGEKCKLRPLVYEDVAYLNRWNQDEQTCKFLGNGFMPVSIDIQKKWMDNMIDTSGFSTSKRYMIDVDNVPVGLVGLYCINWIHRVSEIGIYIGDLNYRKKGIAFEAVKLLMKYAKEYINLRKIKLYVVSDNQNAIVFWKKVGFKVCGELIKERYIEGSYRNLTIMEMFLENDE